jgi:hypothetical protein
VGGNEVTEPVEGEGYAVASLDGIGDGDAGGEGPTRSK